MQPRLTFHRGVLHIKLAKLLFSFTCILSIALIKGALAAPIPEQALQHTQQISRENATRLRQIEDAAEKLRTAPPAASPKPIQASAPVEPKSRCLLIRQIKITGATLVEQSSLERAVSSFSGKCLGLGEFNQILKQVTLAYVDAGYVTARAYLPEQDLMSGNLEVKIIEGKLASIVFGGEDSIARTGSGLVEPEDLRLRMAFPGLIGRPVNLRDLEQGLDQMNRLASVSAKTSMLPGEKTGETIVELDETRTKNWRVNASVDDMGSLSTGRFQSQLGLDYDNLLLLNDTWSLSIQRAQEPHPFAFDHIAPNSTSISGRTSIPFGYWTWFADANWSHYRSEIYGRVSTMQTSGQSNQINTGLSRVLHRDQKSKTTLQVSIKRKQSDNYLMGSLIETGSRALTIAGTKLLYSRRTSSGSMVTSLGYERGLNLWDAFDDGEAVKGSPKGQFSKFTASLDYNHSMALGKYRLTYSGSASAQWSPDELFGSEQMSLGGAGTIPGVRSGILFGNNAALFKNRFDLALLTKSTSDRFRLFDQVTPSLQFNLGRIFPNKKHGIKGGTLAGWAIGLSAQKSNVNFNIDYGRIVSAPKGTDKGEGMFSARASVQF